MAHELDTEQDGTVRFAYNTHNGDPWHTLGVPVDGYGTIDSMLMAASADFEVTTQPVYILGADNSPVIVPDKVATTRTITTLGDDGFTDRTDVLGIVSPSYEVEQNRSAAQFALDCVGASGGDAVIDTMGVLRNGREFFTYLRLEPLVIDPNGVNDVVRQGLAVRTGHDGSLSLCAYPTATRVVCWNTATWSMAAASTVVRVRHTRNKEHYKAEAVRALGIAQKVRDSFIQQAERLLATPARFDTVRNVAEKLWATDPESSKRASTIYDNRMDSLYSLWSSQTNAAGFGDNAWSALNTITEYLDHHRGTTTEKRAIASMNPDGFVTAKKEQAASMLLAGVR